MTVPVIAHARANPSLYFSPIAHAISNAPARCNPNNGLQSCFHDPLSLFYFRTVGMAETWIFAVGVMLPRGSSGSSQTLY